MIRKYIVVMFLMTGLGAPALAAGEYYVARHTKGLCRVLEHKPDGVIWIQVGAASYNTKQEAAAAMKAAPECKK